MYRKKRYSSFHKYGKGTYYETKKSYDYFNGGWSFSSILSEGFSGSIKRAKDQFFWFKRLAGYKKIDNDLREHRNVLERKKKRTQFFYNLKTFFNR